MGRDGTIAWPRGLCSASPGVDPCDAPPPCVSPSCSLSPRQTPLRPSRPRSRSPAGHRGPNCSAAPVATTTSTKAEQASPTCCERRSTSSTATPRPQPQRCPEGPPGRVLESGIGVNVRMATELWGRGRAESQHRPHVELLTNYEALNQFSRQLTSLVNAFKRPYSMQLGGGGMSRRKHDVSNPLRSLGRAAPDGR